MARPLRSGERVPPFSAPDADGRRWTERDLAGRPFVLYFYPEDETPGCVAEACAYRDAWAGFEEVGVAVVGVSRDPPASHAAFRRARRIPFLLLSDEDGAMHEAFGATMLGGLPRRVSYLVGSGLSVEAVFASNLRPALHAERMLEAARRLGASAQR